MSNDTVKVPKVDSKNTKAEILAAYSESLKATKAAKAMNLNPTAVKTAKRKKEVVQKTNGINLDSVKKAVETVRTRTFSALEEIQEQLSNELSTLETVREGIAFQQAENEELFGITAEAESFAALVEAQREKKVSFDTKLQEDRALFNDEMAEDRKLWEIEQADHERAWNLKTNTDEQNRKRNEEEFKYNFKRQSQLETDRLRDQLKTERVHWQDTKLAE